ncbi:MAG: site-2 protease family protein [Acidimicrobiia bacterium]|nr:site-2 protease family protein [Acidimicrobiia bacterium]
MKQHLRLGTISGIPVGLHWGLLVIAWLQAASLAGSLLPAASPGLGSGAYWAAALTGVVLFFASILAHELGHSLVAQREGIRVRSITLWFLGGVAELDRQADRPRAELKIALAGPAVSLVLALGFLAAAVGLEALVGSTLVGTVLAWLAFANGVLAVFNMIPAAPLDGGRVLAAVLWARSGDVSRARSIASRSGRGFGAVLMAGGLLLVFNGLPGGITIVILGWFLRTAATQELRYHELAEQAATLPAHVAMTPLSSPIDSGVTVSGLAAMVSPLSGPVAFPVRDADGETRGIVTTLDAAGVSAKRRSQVTVADIAVGFDRFVGARTDETLSAVLERLGTPEADRAFVYDADGRPAGVIGPAELAAVRSPVAV